MTPRASYYLVVCFPADNLVECDSLADGEKRRQREDGQKCECKDGWGGVNCNGMSLASQC